MSKATFKFLFLSLLIHSCSSAPDSQDATTEAEPAVGESAPESWPDYGNVLNVTTNQIDIQLSDSIIMSGLTTVRYVNKSSMTHFIRFEKMPVVDGEQKTVNDLVEEIDPIFAEGMSLINEGKAEEGMQAFGKIPAWFGQLEFVGGIGIIGPESTAQATFNLPPGTYTIECYIKSNGVFHTSQGMVAGLVAEQSDSAPASIPEADVVINVNEDGYDMQGNPAAGLQSFRVNFHTSTVHENFAMADVNVVRLDDSTNPNAVQVWMNWADPNAFGTPAPAMFVGGIQEMPAGNSGVFTVRLEPGEYALIAEVPESNAKGLFKRFTVPGASAMAE